MTGDAMRIALLAASVALASAGFADGISVSAGGMDFVVPPKGGLMVRKANGKLARVLSFNMRVGGETGKVAAFPDGRDDFVRVVEDSAARCVVRADRSLATRAFEKGAPQVAWDAARLEIDYVFRKDTPGVVVVERLVAKESFTFFSWNVPISGAPVIVTASYVIFEADRSMTLHQSLVGFAPTLVYAAVAYPCNIARVWDGPYPFFQVWNMPVWMSVLWFVALFCLSFALCQIPRLLARRFG